MHSIDRSHIKEVKKKQIYNITILMILKFNPLCPNIIKFTYWVFFFFQTKSFKIQRVLADHITDQPYCKWSVATHGGDPQKSPRGLEGSKKK